MAKRVFLIVLDSFGIGEAPDASNYGDEGSNTIASVVKSGAKLKNLNDLGLGSIDGVNCLAKVNNTASIARMTESSKGKDTTTGHWEMMGIVSNQPMPTYPNGFPQYIISQIEKISNRKVIVNKPYSGVDVINDFGKQHVEKGDLIVYTSADSVLQIAAHEEVVPLNELYDICKKVREIMAGKDAVGRIIARPFLGQPGNFYRTTNRHDFSLVPPTDNALYCLKQSNKDLISVGKIFDIFAGCYFDKSFPTKGNTDGLNKIEEILNTDFSGFCFINLVDFDMLYGHRNDAKGYADALDEFDLRLPKYLSMLNKEDVLMITADHGCDPLTISTDHSREYTPWLIYGNKIKNVNLNTLSSFSDIGATICGLLDTKSMPTNGIDHSKTIIKG